MGAAVFVCGQICCSFVAFRCSGSWLTLDTYIESSRRDFACCVGTPLVFGMEGNYECGAEISGSV